MRSLMLYKGLCVSCQKSNKTFLHGVAAETSKSWKHRWISSPTRTEWLCYVPQPCCCSCSNCAERRCVASAWNYLYFALVPHHFCVGVLFCLNRQQCLTCKMNSQQEQQKKSILCPPGMQKCILTCKINSGVLWVSLCWNALAARSMAHIWAVAFPVVSAFSQRQEFVLSHVPCTSILQGNWSSNASELLKAFWMAKLTFSNLRSQHLLI